MADPKPKPKGGLGKKVGPLPAWGWGLIILAVLAWFLFFRKSNGGTTATSGAGDTGGSSYVPQDNSGQINAAQAGQPSQNSAPADGLSPDVQGTIMTTPSDLTSALTTALQNAYAGGAGGYMGATGYFDPGLQLASQSVAATSTPVSGAKPSGSGGTAPKSTQPFGGIVSKRKLKNGATLTTYANGRTVEQLPGHSPYVTNRGR